MSPHHPSVVTKLDDPEDLLLSYLNADCLDTTTTPSIDTTDTKSTAFPSITSSHDENHPSSLSPSFNYQSSWSSLPFLLDMGSLANVCMDSPGLMTSISPSSISRVGSPSSASPVSTLLSSSMSAIASFSASDTTFPVPQLFDANSHHHHSSAISSSSSPTISSASSSDIEEPKRKRERKRQTGARHSSSFSTSQSIPAMHACKPILPAASTTHCRSINDQQQQMIATSQDHQESPLLTVKSEPVDTDTSILASLDNNVKTHNNNSLQQQQQQEEEGGGRKRININNNGSQKQKISAADAHNKRQERLIKNRAAALLSRKRKREHLIALEHERQWLIKDNDQLKSKADTLEAKLLQLEKDYQHQQQQLLLLQHQQQHSLSYGTPGSCSSDSDSTDLVPPSSPSMDPLSKVTNMLMFILLSFALLTLPVTSNHHLLITEDKKLLPFISASNTGNKGFPDMHLTLSSSQPPSPLQEQQQQKQHHFTRQTPYLRPHTPITDHHDEKAKFAVLLSSKQYPLGKRKRKQTNDLV
ncbi:uncharacterized protein BX664DRAFT_24567 [Halteromyces radiatus]|uniref:uncharacterized protein n=1 Tax=Halteromyces radiatus TaxID=101107 RepID=UPI00221E7B89|nr:uncharacterized protein BX664DRAFT_24567 [Halteromyces radiatus]KAI8099595.1 hypothetical protein BX664DRAFT_24567 [Halteromyces radiatus]